MGDVFRVSISNDVKKTIQNIKEIAGSHSDEEIYAMLKECSMDPNEAAQKLLFQDTFHEVKKKRDKRKEFNNETTYIKWKPGSQGRRFRTSWSNQPPCHAFDDAGTGRVNGFILERDKYSTISFRSTLDVDCKIVSAERIYATFKSRSTGTKPKEPIKTPDDQPYSNRDSSVETAIAIKKTDSSIQEKFSSSFGQRSSPSLASPVRVNTSTFHHRLVVGQCMPAVVGIAKNRNVETVVSHDFGGSDMHLPKENDSSKRTSAVNGNGKGNLLNAEGNQVSDTFWSAPSTVTASTCGSRPSSNYSNRSHHATGSSKAGPAMEWKPKSKNINSARSSEVCSTSDANLNKGNAGDTVSFFFSASESNVSDISTEALRLESLHLLGTQYVIIPNHLQVSESERSGLTFGSFNSNFGLGMELKHEPETIKSSEGPSESSTKLEEKLSFCARGETPVAVEMIAPDDQQREKPESHSIETSDFTSKILSTSHSDQSKEEILSIVGGQHTIIETAPVYSNSGLGPQILSSSFLTIESAEMHARGATCLPTFIVSQSFDPSANCYVSSYRAAGDGDDDGRFSPFFAANAASKNNGNSAASPAQTGQSLQENGSSLMFPLILPTLSTHQATGALQNSAAAIQQLVPIFRQPAGVHISHFPRNYVSYGQYFSPFYVAHPTSIHPFLGNTAVFPQQPPIGNLYAPQAATAGTTPVKHSVSQCKSALSSVPTGQGTYGMNPSGYNPYFGANLTGSEGLLSSQLSESNMFFTRQQSEGSAAVWMSPPGRDISGLHASSFYSVPTPHGHPVAFTATQTGPAGAYTGLYHHPTHSVSTGFFHPFLQQPSAAIGGPSETMGPPSIYQQPQRLSHMNWVNFF